MPGPEFAGFGTVYFDDPSLARQFYAQGVCKCFVDGACNSCAQGATTEHFQTRTVAAAMAVMLWPAGRESVLGGP